MARIQVQLVKDLDDCRGMMAMTLTFTRSLSRDKSGMASGKSDRHVNERGYTLDNFPIVIPILTMGRLITRPRELTRI